MKEMLKINCRLYYRIKQFKNQFIVICLLSLIIVSSLLKSEEPPVGNITVHDLPKCSSTDKLDLNKDMRAAELVQFSEDGSKIKGPFIYRPYLNCLNQEDDRLTDLIRDEYIRPPNNKLLYLNGMEVNSDTAYEITRNEQVVDITELVYKNQVPRNGFYLEAGSHDGINSMSFEFELVHNWTGVLVEADVWLYTHSLELNRKSYQIHTCLAVEKTPHFGMFDMVSAVRGKGLYSIYVLSRGKGLYSIYVLSRGKGLYSIYVLSRGKVLYYIYVLSRGKEWYSVYVLSRGKALYSVYVLSRGKGFYSIYVGVVTVRPITFHPITFHPKRFTQ
ncbi:uncharacterized protein LOC111711255 isoform X2 [Eurytemora carolleeae]|uniref:uncharacterized protein LOC111711255 isoform X2 n=1 Tax=Eurytemora carolleeae TaxID=1294199 RepID=UPI000C77012A|nr:uncharacterized protein LOC111711255 isoform X2 [Eurytemora carolleeae]|eukprot:XP_023341322.1 uncharacterized protein LOC111711255 isoform X2 [Eurytemora affinis]